MIDIALSQWHTGWPIRLQGVRVPPRATMKAPPLLDIAAKCAFLFACSPADKESL